jgi:hypothetical protein
MNKKVGGFFLALSLGFWFACGVYAAMLPLTRVTVFW